MVIYLARGGVLLFQRHHRTAITTERRRAAGHRSRSAPSSRGRSSTRRDRWRQSTSARLLLAWLPAMSAGVEVSVGLGSPQADSTTRLGSGPSLSFTVFTTFTAS